MSVCIFKREISEAFTGGKSVNAIYSYGTKVWPPEDFYTLPDGYQKLSYIQGQVIDYPEHSGSIVPDTPAIVLDMPDIDDLIIEMQVQPVPYKNIDSYAGSSDFIDCGSFAIQDWLFRNYYVVDTRALTYVGNEPPLGSFQWHHGVDYTIRVTRNSTFVDNTLVYRNDDATGERIRTISLLSSYNESTGHTLDGSNHKLFRVKVYNNQTLLMDLVPAFNNEAGLFDLKGKKFYTKHIAKNTLGEDLPALDFRYQIA